jgi:hypothetical protein
VFDILAEIPNSTNKVNHVERLSVIQNKPFAIPYGRMNHLCHHWNKRMLTIVQNIYYSRRARWLPLVDERFVIDSLVAVSIHFFGLGVTNKAAKFDCILPIGDDGSSYKDRSSGKLIVMKITETLLSWKQRSCQ